MSGGYTYDPDFLPADDDEDESEEETEQEQTPKRPRVKKNKALVIGDSQAESLDGLGAAFQKKLNELGYETTRKAYRGQSADSISSHLPSDYEGAGNPGLVVAVVGGNGSLGQTKAGVKTIIDFCQSKGAEVIIVGPGLATKIEDTSLAQRVFSNPDIKTEDYWTSGGGADKNITRQDASDYIDDLAEDGVYGYGIATNMNDGGVLSNAYTSQPDGVHIVNGAQKIAEQILSYVKITSTPAEEEPEGTVADEEKFNSTVTVLDLRDPENYEYITFDDVESPRGEKLPDVISAYNSNRPTYDTEFDAAGNKYGIDPNFLRAIATVESEFTIVAKSNKAARGLMQLMPATAKNLGLKVDESSKDPARDERLDPVKSIQAAAKLLSQNKNAHGGNNLPELAGTYNAGPGYGDYAKKGSPNAKLPRMDSYVLINETRDFMQLVMAAYHEFGGTGYL